MSGSFEKSVKGATKIKNAPPKTKYIEHILVATHSGDAGVGEVFRSLQYRLRDSTWTVVLKSLLTTHIMIREGSQNATLSFLAKHRNLLAVGHFADGWSFVKRARAFRDTKIDWVRENDSRLEKLAVDKGLLRETEIVQNQLLALVKCDVLETEPENEITIAIFRLLVLDLLSLFQVLNQGLINVLGHFFEMSKTDAQRALEIYRTFTRVTDYVVQYLSAARIHEHHTRVEVPKLKHAPVTLARQLEDYLKDPDFEVHRRQYLAEQDAKKTGVSSKAAKIDFPKSPTGPSSPNLNNPFPSVPDANADSKPQANKGPDPDLIDFFDSIEQKQTTLQVNPQPTGIMPAAAPFQPQPAGMPFPQNGFVPQQTGFVPNNMFQQQQNMGGFMPQQQPQQPQQPQSLQPNFTGAGFGGFTPQPNFQPGALGPIPQNLEATFLNPNQGFQYGQQQQQQQQQQQPQSLQAGQPNPLQPTPTATTNPFRQSMMPLASMPVNSSPFSSSGPTPQVQRQSTNPFARSPPQSTSPFQSAMPIQAQPTGTNPFAKMQQQPQQVQSPDQSLNPGPLGPQPTGTTNPFRHGAFVNHNTGMGWQHNQTSIGGGLDQLPTVPVFPRPAQQTPWQQ
ncbi:ENTH domain containing protein [Metarhizium acridum CQMa 102]|uniref:ENTH domain containing protein n=1 Tax=Metarhizium acridum (strain CQMa 102) TaxID=655827 RepID=E9E2B3_METAQ|nr:ENTH domain containing protein [Metarhizium acridum CQMa 102]EFY90029.1 ENTH domain containing protein [Metarhizium acridum CQMa 102]